MSLIAAEATEVTKLEPAHRKIYVLDTNVLLHDPTAITAFAEHQVVIPMTVLEELDHIKDRKDKSVSREARIAIQLIDKLVGNASPQEIQSGVDITGSNLDENRLGRLAIFPDQLIAIELLRSCQGSPFRLFRARSLTVDRDMGLLSLPEIWRVGRCLYLSEPR